MSEVFNGQAIQQNRYTFAQNQLQRNFFWRRSVDFSEDCIISPVKLKFHWDQFPRNF